MDAIEKIEYRGLTIEACYDEGAQDPRADFDHLATMVCWHRRYDLGDKHRFETPDEFLDWYKKNQVIILPVYIYDHSGITISTTSFMGRLPQGHAEFDSMHIGWIYMTNERFKAECVRPDGSKIKHLTRDDRERARRLMDDEIKEYNEYLSGQVYGYVVNGVDSCWGFYGEDGYKRMIEEAKEQIDLVLKGGPE